MFNGSHLNLNFQNNEFFISTHLRESLPVISKLTSLRGAFEK